MNDPIPNQIDSLGDRRLAGCAVKAIVLFVLGCLALGFTAKRTHDAGIRLAVALAMSGLLFGFAASGLTPRAREFLTRVFVLLPLVVTLLLFAYRTLFGRSEELPLRLVLAPLALAVAFLIGRGRRTSP